MESSGSNPGSPNSTGSTTNTTNTQKTTPALGSSPINSKSLPNIPSSLDTSRRSPPAANMRVNHRRNPLEKSHSYAILPLRKHLMQKSMLERRSMDDNQYSYMRDKMERERQHKPRLIRPLGMSLKVVFSPIYGFLRSRMLPFIINLKPYINLTIIHFLKKSDKTWQTNYCFLKTHFFRRSDGRGPIIN